MRLREIEGEEGGSGPRYDESRELDDGESREIPRHPELEEEVAFVGLEEFPLLFGRFAATEPGIFVRVDVVELVVTVDF